MSLISGGPTSCVGRTFTTVGVGGLLAAYFFDLKAAWASLWSLAAETSRWLSCLRWSGGVVAFT